jgi:hypothetical protein
MVNDVDVHQHFHFNYKRFDTWLGTPTYIRIDKFGLTKKLLCYIKDQGANLQTLAHALKSIVNCESLHTVVPFENGACFYQIVSICNKQ